MESSLKSRLNIFACTAGVFLLSYLTGFFFGYTSFTFSWVLNFLLMALFTLTAQKLPLSLGSSYFEEKSFERRGSIYEILGIRLFRKLLIWIGWEKIQRQNKPVRRDRASLRRLEYDTRVSEFGHTCIAAFLILLTLVLADSLWEAKWLLLTNLFLNIYPIMLQRYNRPRYHRILQYQSLLEESEDSEAP